MLRHLRPSNPLLASLSSWSSAASARTCHAAATSTVARAVAARHGAAHASMRRSVHSTASPAAAASSHGSSAGSEQAHSGDSNSDSHSSSSSSSSSSGGGSDGPEQPWVDPNQTWLDRMVSNANVRRRVLTCVALGIGISTTEKIASQLPSVAAWQMAIDALREAAKEEAAQNGGSSTSAFRRARYATPSKLWTAWKREQRLMAARREEEKRQKEEQAAAAAPAAVDAPAPPSSWRAWLPGGEPHPYDESWDPERRPLVFDALQMELERLPSLAHLDLLERGDVLRQRRDAQVAAVWEVLLRMDALCDIRSKWGKRKAAEMERREQMQMQSQQQQAQQ